jgi:dihydrofolate synthase / folylpolyglutamate synthase
MISYQASVRELLALGRELAAPRQPVLSAAPAARVHKFGLENISLLSADLGNPHLAVPCAHVAGTNGKGSTAAMLDSILCAAGLRSGLYTSPHLERINERIRIAGGEINDAEFAAAWGRVRASIEALIASGKLAAHPTFFECVTAIAFLAFAERRLDFAVYEVGLGGRLDSTNIVAPHVAIITQIDFDHENYLGHSIEEIAFEKAGIIKPGLPVVSSAERSEARSIIQNRCAQLGCRLVEIDSAWRLENLRHSDGCYRARAIFAETGEAVELNLPLPGRFQVRNALSALTAAALLRERGIKIDSGAMAEGIASVKWPGRLERVGENPAVYLDGAHNTAGARELLRFWQEHWAGRRVWIIYGALRDKPVDEIASLLFPHAEAVIFTQPHQPRAISASLLEEMAGHHSSQTHVVPDSQAALARALELAAPNDVILITGSLYLVGEVRHQVAKLPQQRITARRAPQGCLL